MDGQMKAAFCLSGMSRAIAITYTPLRKFFIDKYNCDVFFKSWSSTDNEIDVSPIRAVELYKPKAWELEFFDPYFYDKYAMELCNGFSEREHETWVKNRPRVISMWYNVYKCYLMMEWYANVNNITYDIVFRGRPDGWYVNNFDFRSIEPDTLYILGSKFNDGFAAGDMRTMREYSELYLALRGHVKRYDELPTNHWLCPHKLLDFHLDYLQNKKIKVVKIKENVVRAGKIWDTNPIKPEDNVQELIHKYDEESRQRRII